MTLSLDVSVSRGTFRLVARLSADHGDVVGVVGPNGSGKSTLLRAIAGLEPVAGTVTVDGTDVRGRPPERRPVAWVPQRGALFPHLSVLDNVAFGVGGRTGRRDAQEWLERLGVDHLSARRPGQLSGGQAQKVALARALARRPRVLLLDEPLSALDSGARADVRRTLREHLSAFDGSTVLVTHDAVDAATLATRLVALERGQVVQEGSTADVTRAPRTPWLAEMLGANACHGRVRDGAVDVAPDGRIVAVDLPDEGAEVLAVFPPHAVTLHADPPHGSARNVWPVMVRGLTEIGGRVRVDVEGHPPLVAEVTTAAVTELELRAGRQAWASVKATEVVVVPL